MRRLRIPWLLLLGVIYVSGAVLPQIQTLPSVSSTIASVEPVRNRYYDYKNARYSLSGKRNLYEQLGNFYPLSQIPNPNGNKFRYIPSHQNKINIRKVYLGNQPTKKNFQQKSHKNYNFYYGKNFLTNLNSRDNVKESLTLSKNKRIKKDTFNKIERKVDSNENSAKVNKKLKKEIRAKFLEKLKEKYKNSQRYSQKTNKKNSRSADKNRNRYRDITVISKPSTTNIVINNYGISSLKMIEDLIAKKLIDKDKEIQNNLLVITNTSSNNTHKTIEVEQFENEKAINDGVTRVRPEPNTLPNDETLFMSTTQHTDDDKPKAKYNTPYVEESTWIPISQLNYHVDYDLPQDDDKSIRNEQIDTRKKIRVRRSRKSRLINPKHWPHTKVTTLEDIENYNNYTTFNEDYQHINVSKETLSESSNYGGKNPVQQTVMNFAIGTSQRKPTIHKVVTSWSDTPNLENIRDTWKHGNESNNQDDHFNFNDNQVSNVTDDIVYQRIINNGSLSEDDSIYNSQNGNSDWQGDLYDEELEKVVYISPKPVKKNGQTYEQLEEITTRPKITIDNALINRYSDDSALDDSKWNQSISNSVIGISSQDSHSIPITVIGQPAGIFDHVIGESGSYLNDGNINFGHDQPSDVTNDYVDDDCPTVYVTLNNTIESEAKQRCADVHLIINSKIHSSNVFISDQHQNDEVFPVDDNDSNDTTPLGPFIPIIPPIIPVPIPIAHPGTHSLPLPVSAAIAVPVVVPVVAVGGGGGGGGGGKPHKGSHSLQKHKYKVKHHDEGSYSLKTLIGVASSVTNWFAFLSPTFGIFSLFFAPLSILAVGGVSLLALLSEWAFDDKSSSKNERIVFVNKHREPNWKWDDGHKTWNWAPYPNKRFAQKKDPRENIDRSDSGFISTLQNIKYKFSNTYENVRKWAYDKYRRTFGRSYSRRGRNFNENWKRRRK